MSTYRYSGVYSEEIPSGKRWITGSTLSVRFMGGTQSQHGLVREQAAWWTKHANLDVDFNDAPNARIRMTFDPIIF